MKIMLVRPKPHPDTIGLQSIMICEPLELEYLAAAVRHQHEVVLIDLILEKAPLISHLREHQPDVVAMTAYIAHVNVVKEYASIIKAYNPQTTVIVGGVHAEVMAEDFLDCSIDFIVRANPIRSFVFLLTGLQTQRANVIPKIFPAPDSSQPAVQELIPPVLPDRKITAKYRDRYYYIYHNPCALLKTSYGCPFSCIFCFCRQITGGAYIERDLHQVVEEILTITEPEIYIVDDNFLVSKERVETFCDLLEQYDIKKRFLIYGRADFIAHNEKTISRFAKLGLRAVIVGVESSNPSELTKYNKNSSVAANEAAIGVLHKHGVDCYATLILGLDWTKNDFAKLRHWLLQQKLRFINLQPFTPLPGTPLYDEYKDQLIIPRERYQEWDLANVTVRPLNLSLRSYYFQIIKLYFAVSLNTHSLRINLRHGIKANLKLSLGVAKITWQYLKKMFHGQG